jgi:hypothetical protein
MARIETVVCKIIRRSAYAVHEPMFVREMCIDWKSGLEPWQERSVEWNSDKFAIKVCERL